MASVDSALLEAAMAAREAAKEAKRERARAMDAIVDLLFERAELKRQLAEERAHVDRMLARG